MAHYWGPSPPRAQSQASTLKKTTLHKSTLSPTTPPTKRQKTSDSPAIQHRNQKAKALAAERDGLRCVITKAVSIEVAYIYPFHSISHQEADKFGHRHIFWAHLKNFWSQEKIAAWEAELFPAGLHKCGIERVYNLISLSRIAYDLWARGAFALKPISQSEDKTTLKVQLFWQKKQQEAQTAISLSTTPFSTKGLSQNINILGGGAARLFREDEGDENSYAIRSGDYFTLQTNDPETKPLPSFTLLELQWFLQRVIGIAGAADVDWPSLSDSGSDISDVELPDLELDEEEDLSQLLSSPTKLVCNDNSNLPIHPKQQEAKGEGEGEGAEQGRQVALLY